MLWVSLLFYLYLFLSNWLFIVPYWFWKVTPGCFCKRLSLSPACPISIHHSRPRSRATISVRSFLISPVRSPSDLPPDSAEPLPWRLSLLVLDFSYCGTLLFTLLDCKVFGQRRSRCTQHIVGWFALKESSLNTYWMTFQAPRPLLPASPVLTCFCQPLLNYLKVRSPIKSSQTCVMPSINLNHTPWAAFSTACLVCGVGSAGGFIYGSRTLCSGFSRKQLRPAPSLFLVYFSLWVEWILKIIIQGWGCDSSGRALT
jgi:hypothetical protein